MVESNEQLLNDVFRALSDPTRRRMLQELAAAERSVGELAAPLDMSLAAASKHIKVLENAGLIHREVRWRKHVCSLQPGPLASVHEWLGVYHRYWTERLDVLENLLTEINPTAPEVDKGDEQ